MAKEKGHLKEEMKLLAIVPAFNEEKIISNVIDSLTESSLKPDIVVINDCSNDNTLTQALNNGKAYVVDLPCNLGIGGAVQTGFKFAEKHDYDFAFQFDGDGQHLASEIEKLISPLIKDEADVVIGSRFIEKHSGFRSTLPRRIGIGIFKLLNSVLIRQKITDNTSGFRAYNKKAIRFLADNYPSDYPEPEAVILLGKNNFRITELSVNMIERETGVSSINSFRAIYYMLKVILSVLMCASRSSQFNAEHERL